MERLLVGAVVVAYHPPVAILQNIAALAPQVGHVVVVDNTPCSKPADVLNDLESLPACTVIRNGQNLGMATALNIGISNAISKGFAWIITFDQDSRVPSGYVEEMISTYEEAADHCRVGMVCPQYRDARLGGLVPAHRAANGKIFSCFTSGSMIGAGVFEKMGFMDERLFIDFVDIEYCLRLRAAGFELIESRKAALGHSLGRITLHKFFGFSFYTTNHSPERRYYITRNRLVLMRRFFRKDREWVIGDFKGMILDAVKILLAEQRKAEKAWYMLRGVHDAIFGKLGERVPL